MKYARLFEPLQMGTLMLENRIVMPPMTTNYAKDGKITDAMVEYYAARARGGTGLLIIEDAIIDSPVGHHTYDCLLIDKDSCIKDMKRLVQTVHREGSKIIQNINHGGRRSGRVENGKLLVTRGEIPVAPSSLAHPVTGFVVPRQLTIEEIADVQKKFAQAARRVREAGFDGLSIHAAHMYLISEFLSPLSNVRTDRYGGSFENRMRFLTEIIEKIRKEVGESYPIMVRINGREGLGGGLTPEDAKDIAVHLEKAGIQCISLSCGAGIPPAEQGFPTPVAPCRLPHGLEVHLAASVKQGVKIPVMTANRIVTPQEAEDILVAGKADLIGIGRGVISDPEWPKKAREGREREIRFCVGCMYCLKTVLEERNEMRCACNAEVGKESSIQLKRAEKPKRVFVVGGGPAGMEAARVAALRGHEVTLFEKDRLGGQLSMAAIPPGKQDIRYLIDFEQNELDRLGVKIQFEELDITKVQAEKPDAMILASGAEPLLLEIPGRFHRPATFTAWQVLKGHELQASDVVVVGGGQVGLETAEYLAVSGKKVTVVEQLDNIGSDMDRTSFILLSFQLDSLGVDVLTRAVARKFDEGGIWINHRGEDKFLKTDGVVFAVGARPKTELGEDLQNVGIAFCRVGDCIRVRRFSDAITEGFEAAIKL